MMSAHKLAFVINVMAEKKLSLSGTSSYRAKKKPYASLVGLGSWKRTKKQPSTAGVVVYDPK